MKTLFIPAKVKSALDSKKINSLIKKLPKEIFLAYSIQYKEKAFEIKKILSKSHKISGTTQVLGCSSPKIPPKTKAILLIGSGKFHASSLAFETKLPVFIFENNNITEVSKEEIISFEKKKKASYVNFLNADSVGILVSTKPGQENLKKALEIKKKIKDKKSYLFIANELNANEFENFGLKSWINTACPRMDIASNKIINASEVKL